MKPRTGRIVGLFVLAFVALGAPVAVVFVLGLFGPPAYLLHADQLGPEWSQATPFPDGSVVQVRTYASASGANDGAVAMADSIPTSSMTKTLNVVRYTAKNGDRWHGMLLPVENRVIQIDAADDRTIEERLKSLPFVSENPRKNVVWLALNNHLGAVLVSLAAYVALWFFFVGRMATWAASVSPMAGVTPVPAQALRDRLLAINGLNLPFQLVEQPGGRLLAEWRIADIKWSSILQTGRLRMAHRVYMKLDAGSNRVRVVEQHRTAVWSGGIGGTGKSWSFFQGITFFQYAQGAEAGLFFKHKQWKTTAYNYQYNLAEMKNPLIEAVVGSGWTFAPVTMFFRPLGG